MRTVHAEASAARLFWSKIARQRLKIRQKGPKFAKYEKRQLREEKGTFLTFKALLIKLY